VSKGTIKGFNDLLFGDASQKDIEGFANINRR
jgi:hypothetical protein